MQGLRQIARAGHHSSCKNFFDNYREHLQFIHHSSPERSCRLPECEGRTQALQALSKQMEKTKKKKKKGEVKGAGGVEGDDRAAAAKEVTVVSHNV